MQAGLLSVTAFVCCWSIFPVMEPSDLSQKQTKAISDSLMYCIYESPQTYDSDHLVLLSDWPSMTTQALTSWGGIERTGDI